MIRRAITIGAAVLFSAIPAAAQQRGTMEFGAFASAGTFDKSLTLNSGFGGGGRIGMYLDRNWVIEFEEGEMSASRTLGLANVNVGELTGRLVGTLFRAGPVAIMLGGGAGSSSETNFLHSYGVNAMLAAKIKVSSNAAIRIDGISDWLANYSWKSNQSLHVGLSLYRSPNHTVQVVDVPVAVVAPVAVFTQLPDSVSAEEQARRRRAEREYRDLRDSLSRPSAVVIPDASSASALATMEEKIHFATDKSELTPEARATLDAKVLIFRANPAMRIIIVGNTDERASDAYNMGLGERRATAAKAYLVAQGIDPIRIEVTSHGERNPIAPGTSKDAEALNRRDGFRLLIASDYLVPGKP